MNLINTVKTNCSVKPLALCCLIAMSLSPSAHAQERERGGRNMPKHERPEFSALDLDGDGSVSYAEFEHSEVPNNEHATIFSHIDVDGDGVFTEQEYTNHKPPGRKR